MGQFLQSEKKRAIEWKRTSNGVSQDARSDGTYEGRVYPFCLADGFASENLYSRVRKGALAFFEAKHIAWHGDDECSDLPSNHLCDSQVCCVNFLFPFSKEPDALFDLLKPVFPDIVQIVPMEDSGELVTFEWIGLDNYLGEKIRKGTTRTRGKNFTSADAAVMFKRRDGRQQIVLIEWKYTESYSDVFMRIAKSGTDRREIYKHILDDPECFLNREVLSTDDALFYEPFYQFFRQQALAWKMEKAKELDADIVSVLHIAPCANHDFRLVTSPKLQNLGETATAVWKGLLREPEKFVSVTTEDLFGKFPIDHHPQLNDWWKYIRGRYTWVCEMTEHTTS
jgi:hypothetical protein